MKKNVLALSIAAMIGGLGFAGAASAAVLSGTAGGPLVVSDGTPANNRLTGANADGLEFAEGGVGHMLLVPYYSAQNGNMTVLHVVNTDTKNGKAIKVRFRGASNSDDVLDFQVFLSPQDVWTAAVSQGADGVAQIVTADNTCTVPRLNPGQPQSFVTTRVNPNSDKAEQTREGYVEIFNIADISGEKIWGSKANQFSELYTLTKHKNGVAPCSDGGTNWSALEQIAIEDHDEQSAVAVGFDTPTGGLAGDWYIINVPQTTTFSGGATAVRATTTAVGATVARGNFVHFPQDDGAVAGIDNFTADPLFRSTNVLDVKGVTAATIVPALDAGNYDLPDLSTPYLALTAPIAATDPLDQAVALTNALAVQSVSNQYTLDEPIQAKTDWVFSMPTRRYSVAANYAILADASNTKGYGHDEYRLFSDLSAATVATEWQATWFRPATGADVATNTGPLVGVTNTSVDENGNICVTVDNQKFYDREESEYTVTNGSVFSPAKPGQAAKFSLCGEVSVLAFKDAGASVLGASERIARQTAAASILYKNGWGVVTTGNKAKTTPATAATATPGLPLLGASFIKLTNSAVSQGMSGTYGITWPHRFTK